MQVYIESTSKFSSRVKFGACKCRRISFNLQNKLPWKLLLYCTHKKYDIYCQTLPVLSMQIFHIKSIYICQSLLLHNYL